MRSVAYLLLLLVVFNSLAFDSAASPKPRRKAIRVLRAHVDAVVVALKNKDIAACQKLFVWSSEMETTLKTITTNYIDFKANVTYAKYYGTEGTDAVNMSGEVILSRQSAATKIFEDVNISVQLIESSESPTGWKIDDYDISDHSKKIRHNN